MDNLSDSIWMEKYRPKNIKSIILPLRMMNHFKKIIESGTIPNMILYSTRPGSGKTTTAKALCRDMNIDYLYINASLNRGIDTLRDEIQSYATTLSLSGGMKVAILDEFDGTNDTFQKAMRAAIEEFSETCRFILTCNNISKIIEPIRSRCEVNDFNFNDEKIKTEMVPKIYKRLCGILNAENVQFNDEALKKLSLMYFPDIRHMIKLCQQFSSMYGCVTDEIFRFRQIEEELIELIIGKKVTAARKYIIDKSYDYDQLYRFLFDRIPSKISDPNDRGRAILCIEEYMTRSKDSLDKEITFTACIIKLCEVL